MELLFDNASEPQVKYVKTMYYVTKDEIKIEGFGRKNELIAWRKTGKHVIQYIISRTGKHVRKLFELTKDTVKFFNSL